MPKHPEFVARIVVAQLKAYMAKERINQTQLANRLEIASGQVNRWLNKGNISGVWIRLLRAKGIVR